MRLPVKALYRLIQSDLAIRAVSVATGKSTANVKAALERAIRPEPPLPEPPLTKIAKLIGLQNDLEIVQVGANDGKTDDPVFSLVHNHATRALLIEPQPWLISELRANYDKYNGQLYIENCAITSCPGHLDLYILQRKYWAQYIHNVGRHPSAIFSPDIGQLLSRIAPRLKMSDSQAREAIEKISVPAFSLEYVMKKHNFTNADIVQIDCEGWDFEVIKSLGNIKPPVINFESFNLSQDTWNKFRAWASANSYGYIRGPQDTLALRSYPRQIEN